MAKRRPAGEFRHKVSIQEHNAKTTFDSYGQIEDSSTAWETQKTVRAKVEPLDGQEGMLVRQMYPKATRRIVIDYQSTMDSTGATELRVQFGSRNLYIHRIDVPDEEKWEMELLCGEER